MNEQKNAPGAKEPTKAPSVLPEKMSELLTVAIDDLESVEADPRYVVDMDDWHVPVNDYCEVCLAGAVMAKSLGASPDEDLLPYRFRNAHSRLSALDELRRGHVAVAAQFLGIKDVPEELEIVEITPYEYDAEDFKSDLRDLAAKLKEAGL